MKDRKTVVPQGIMFAPVGQERHLIGGWYADAHAYLQLSSNSWLQAGHE